MSVKVEKIAARDACPWCRERKALVGACSSGYAGFIACAPCASDLARALGEVVPPSTAGNEADLVMLVKLLVRRCPPDDTVAAKARDFLRRKGLQGSPLREGRYEMGVDFATAPPTVVALAPPKPPCSRCGGRGVVPEFHGPRGLPSHEMRPCPECAT